MHVVDGVENKTPIRREDPAALEHLGASFLRCSKGQRLLGVHTAAPEGQLVAMAVFQRLGSMLLGIRFLRGALECALEGIGEGRKGGDFRRRKSHIAWYERSEGHSDGCNPPRSGNNTPLTQPHSPAPTCSALGRHARAAASPGSILGNDPAAMPPSSSERRRRSELFSWREGNERKMSRVTTSSA
jgi:hypothetical protein